MVLMSILLNCIVIVKQEKKITQTSSKRYEDSSDGNIKL